jgi:aminopeptidase N
MEDVFLAEKGTGTTADFSQFRLWYSQAGTPELIVTSSYDKSKKTYALTVRQERPKNSESSHEWMLLPLAVGLLEESGKDILLSDNLAQLKGDAENGSATKLLLVTQQEETFVFDDMPQEPVPSLLRGFTAPINLHYDYSDEDLLFLFLNDSDSFSRWEAGQRFYCRKLISLVTALQNGKTMEVDPGLEMVFAKLLGMDTKLDKSFLAQMLTLPSEEYLAEQMDEIDVDAIHGARKFLRQKLALSAKDTLLAIYKANSDSTPYRYDPVLTGSRRLKNLCLSYLMELKDPQIWELGQQQFSQTDNMSDEMASLHAIVNSDSPHKKQVLADFSNKWQHESLVMDKWFTLQATVASPHTLDKVLELMEHPLFSIKNPNKVRSLIGAFAGANPVCFHAEDGRGYKFLADQVIVLDKLNPHISSRLLSRFSHWRKYDKNRQQLMKAQLERVVGSTSLSKGVYEVALKCLGRDS